MEQELSPSIMPEFIHNEVALHYEVAGGPALPWVIFSTSLGADLSMWEPQVAAFSRSFAVLRYDTHGLGQSSSPPGPYDIAQHGQDVLALADHLGIDVFYFCGLSMGGLIGQWLALNAPQRLHKLVLCNTAAKIGTADSWNERIAVVESSGVSAIVGSGLQRWFTSRFAAQHPETIQHFRSMILANRAEGYVGNCAVVRDSDFRTQLSSVATPTLVVCATHDVVTTVADADFLAQSIRGAQKIELDAAHLSNVEQADVFNQAVLKFLAASDR